MRANRSGVLLLYFIIFLLLSLLPDFFADSFRSSIDLCLKSLIPSLFPHLFLASFFVKSGAAVAAGNRLKKITHRIFHLNENCAAVLLLGNLSGYPTGAKTISSLYREKQISKKDAERLLFFSCNAGPGFIFGAIGGAVYNSALVGAALFGIHLIAGFLCGFLLPAQTKIEETQAPVRKQPKNLSECFVESVGEASVTMGKICAFVCLFSLLIQTEQALFGKYKIFTSILAGLTELSSGCVSLAKAELRWTLKFILTAGFIGFGGLCVAAQTMAVLSNSGLSVRSYIVGKLLHGIISALLAWPVSYFIRPFTAATSQTFLLQPFSPLPWRILSIGLVFLIFLHFPSGNLAEDRL